MLERGRAHVDRRVGPALRRVTEEGADIGLHRAALERGDAAVGGPVVREVLVVRRDPGVLARGHRHRGVDPVALQVHIVAEAVGVLVHAVEAERHLVRDHLADVHRAAPRLVGPALERELPDRRPVRLLRHPVDDAPARASPEDQGVGSLQRFDPLHVVEVAEILHVVAHPVHEERGGGVVPPHGDLVAVALALAHGDAGDVAGDVGHPQHRLVGDQRVADDRDRLGHVTQRRGGPGGRRDHAGGGRTRRDHLDRIELVGAGHRAERQRPVVHHLGGQVGAGDQSPQRLLRREPSHHSRRVHGRYLRFGPHLNAGLASELPDRIRERLGCNAEVAPDQGVALRVRDGDRGQGVLVSRSGLSV